MGRNFDVFDTFQPDRQNITCQIFTALKHLQARGKTVTICQNILSNRKINIRRSSPFKILCYTVYSWLAS